MPRSAPVLKLRALSVAGRHLDAYKDYRRVAKKFDTWCALQRSLPARRVPAKHLLIIRLDDIGDYLLFRNCLEMYKRSPRWRDYRITLLGNSSWRDLWMSLDQDTVDDVLWVHKNTYLQEADCRWDVWTDLRRRGFAAVVAPSRTRPPLLDDLCMLAAGAPLNIGSVNTYRHEGWNRRSDRLYTEIFPAGSAASHEFSFNRRFNEWACGVRGLATRPSIPRRFEPPRSAPYLLCFVGASTRSRRWPVRRWIEFIETYTSHCTEAVVLAGGSPAEAAIAAQVQAATTADSIVGKVSLPELMGWVAGARAVLTNDTMAAHLSAALDRPTLVVANGGNHMRFTEYGVAGMEHVLTVYPDTFQRWRRRVGDSVPHYVAVSADIASIDGRTVFDELQRLLAKKDAPSCIFS